MNTKLIEWVDARIKDDDMYYRFCDDNDTCYKITAITDREMLAYSHRRSNYKFEAVFAMKGNHKLYSEYAIAYALADADEAIIEDIYEKHRHDGVNLNDPELDGNFASIISPVSMNRFVDWEDERINIIENEYDIPAADALVWLENNKHLQDKIEEQAYDIAFENWKETWVPMIGVEEIVITGQGDKGDLVWDCGTANIFIPENDNIATMYGPRGKSTWMRLPYDGPLALTMVEEMLGYDCIEGGLW